MSSPPTPPPARPAFTPGVLRSGWLAVSGQLGTDRHGRVVAGGVEAETVQALRNLKAVLAGFGLSTDALVKVNLFLTDLTDLPRVNELYAEFLEDRLPARTAVEVAALPRGAVVEIEAWAVSG